MGAKRSYQMPYGAGQGKELQKVVFRNRGASPQFNLIDYKLQYGGHRRTVEKPYRTRIVSKGHFDKLRIQKYSQFDRSNDKHPFARYRHEPDNHESPNEKNLLARVYRVRQKYVATIAQLIKSQPGLEEWTEEEKERANNANPACCAYQRLAGIGFPDEKDGNDVVMCDCDGQVPALCYVQSLLYLKTEVELLRRRLSSELQKTEFWRQTTEQICSQQTRPQLYSHGPQFQPPSMSPVQSLSPELMVLRDIQQQFPSLSL